MPLTAETGFPGGNAGGVRIGGGGTAPEVAFTADPHGGPEALWFDLRVRRAGEDPVAGAPVRIVLEHPDNLLGGAEPERIRPVVRSDAHDWERLPAGAVETTADGRRRVAWTVPAPATWLELAACYPYGAEQLTALVRDGDGALHEEVIGLSQGGRPLVRLSNGTGEPGSARPGLYLLARQHSGETPGSWFLDGFVRWCAGHPGRSPLVWAVPFANPDGVEAGDYGKDNFPYDLNRAWGDPPMRHETLVIMKDLERWRARCRPVLALDCHAPGLCEAEGIYAFVPNPAKQPADAATGERWAAVVAAALAPEYTAPKVNRIAYYASRWTTPSFSAYCFGMAVPALTVEIPYAECRPGGTLFTRDRYRDAGARLAAAVTAAAEAGT